MSGREILRAAHQRLNLRKTAIIEGAGRTLEGEVHDTELYAPLFIGLDVDVHDLEVLLHMMLGANYSKDEHVVTAVGQLARTGHEEGAKRLLGIAKGLAVDAFLMGAFAAQIQAEGTRS